MKKVNHNPIAGCRNLVLAISIGLILSPQAEEGMTIGEALDQPELGFRAMTYEYIRGHYPNPAAFEVARGETHDNRGASLKVLPAPTGGEHQLWIDRKFDVPTLVSFRWKSASLYGGIFSVNRSRFNDSKNYLGPAVEDKHFMSGLPRNTSVGPNPWSHFRPPSVWAGEAFFDWTPFSWPPPTSGAAQEFPKEVLLWGNPTEVGWRFLSPENVFGSQETYIDDLVIQPLRADVGKPFPLPPGCDVYSLDFVGKETADFNYWSLDASSDSGVRTASFNEASRFLVTIEGPATVSFDLAMMWDGGWTGHKSPMGVFAWEARRHNDTVLFNSISHPGRPWAHDLPEVFGPSVFRTDSITIGPGKSSILFTYYPLLGGNLSRQFGMLNGLSVTRKLPDQVLMESLESNIDLFSWSPWRRNGTSGVVLGEEAPNWPGSHHQPIFEDGSGLSHPVKINHHLYGKVNGPGTISFRWRFDKSSDPTKHPERKVSFFPDHSRPESGHTSRTLAWRTEWTAEKIVISESGEVPFNFQVLEGGIENFYLDDLRFTPGTGETTSAGKAELKKKIQRTSRKLKKALRLKKRNLIKRLRTQLRRLNAMYRMS